MALAAATDLEPLVRREHASPHDILGAHAADGAVVIRAFRPSAASVRAVPATGDAVELEQIHPGGVFEGIIAGAELRLAYTLEVDYGEAGTVTIEDPYRFLPTVGELDLHLVGEGRHEELWTRLGAHVREGDGVRGPAFSVWAPAARAVSVVGDFNFWDGRVHPMRAMGASGVWELFLPDVGSGARYKYESRARDGETRLKADPVAFATEVPPKTASVVHESTHEWADEKWLEERRNAKPLDGPMSIYEVTLGSRRCEPARGAAT